MQLKDLYIKPINRSVNPAVSATKFDKETIDIEIKEYVFTDEILNGLYRILDAIRNNKPYDHVGIWIDGYYGSGKSHFLKYLDYCITPETRDVALERLLDAVKEIDPFDGKHNLQFEFSQVQDIVSWLKIPPLIHASSTLKLPTMRLPTRKRLSCRCFGMSLTANVD